MSENSVDKRLAKHIDDAEWLQGQIEDFFAAIANEWFEPDCPFGIDEINEFEAWNAEAAEAVQKALEKLEEVRDGE